MEIKRIIKRIVDFLGDQDVNPDDPVYDPVHVGAMIVLVVMSVSIIFWLLWALVVCEGGLFTKIIPLVQVVFTSKTVQDFGYKGYPYELGIFEGWIVNGASLVILILLLIGIHSIFKNLKHREKMHGIQSK